MSTVASASTMPGQGTGYVSVLSSNQLGETCALLALLVQTQSVSQCGSKTDIELDAKKLEELKQQIADAIQKAKDAAHKSGILGSLGTVFGVDVAEIAGAIAAVAAIVASGGAAGPIILIALAEGLQVGAKVGAELGLDPKLCMAISLASVAVGFCTGTGAAQATSMLAKGARYVELGAKIVQGAATATGGALNYSAAHYHAKDQRYQASTVRYQADEDTTNLDIDDALSLLQNSLRGGQHELETVSQLQQDNADTNTSLANRI